MTRSLALVTALLAGCHGAPGGVAIVEPTARGEMVFRNVPPPPSRAAARGPARLVFHDRLHGVVATTGGGYYQPKVGYVRPIEPARIQLTSDGGVTWRTVLQRRRTVFRSLAFADRRDGVAFGAQLVGANGIRLFALSTGDGGRTWRKRGMPRVAQRIEELPELEVVTRDVWLIGELRTLDGGRSWSRLPLPRGTTVRVFRSPDDGVAGAPARGCDGAIWRTDDGGASWHVVRATCGAPIQTLHYVSARVVYAAGGYSWQHEGTGPMLIRRSRDGGRTWETRARVRQGRWPAVVRFAFATASSGWVVSSESIQGFTRATVRVTDDGGRTWKFVAFPAVPTAFVGRTHAWVGAESDARLFRTRDRGRTWQLFARPEAIGPYELSAGANRDLLMNTAVGFVRGDGARWRPVGRPSVRRLARFHGELAYITSPEHDMRAVARWVSDSRRVQVPRRLWSVGAITLSGREGFAASGDPMPDGQYAPVFHTRDGGRSWRRLRVPRGVHPSAPVVLAPGLVALSHAFADGSLVLTTDAGRSWQRFRGHFSSCRADVVEREHIWILCDRGLRRTRFVVLVSHDAGAHWDRYETSRALGADIAAVGHNEAWILTKPSSINGARALLHTTDGGATWSEVWPQIAPGARAHGLVTRDWFLARSSRR